MVALTLVHVPRKRERKQPPGAGKTLYFPTAAVWDRFEHAARFLKRKSRNELMAGLLMDWLEDFEREHPPAK